MKTSPRHSPRGSLSLSHHATESIYVNSADVDEAKSPHALDCRDPNYDPFDEDSAYVDFYMTEEAENLGTVPYHVVRSSRATPAKPKRGTTAGRFGMPSTPTGAADQLLPPIPLSEFKSAVDASVEELVASKDFASFIERLVALNCRLFHDELVAHLIRLSLDKEDRDRDIIAELLTLMRKSGHVSSGQLSRGFDKLFLTWEDILLDVPAAVAMILRFVEISIADGCLPDGFLGRLPEPFLVRITEDGEIERNDEQYPVLARQLSGLQEYKRKCTAILEEYLVSNGAEPVEEIAGRLRRLGGGLHHEFIRRAVNLGIDRADKERELVCKLLLGLRDVKALTEDDFLWAFSHLLGSLPDLAIDCPQAVELVSKFLIRGVADEVIPPSFLDNAARLGLGDAEAAAAVALAKSALENHQVEWADLRNVWAEIDVVDDAKWRAELDLALREYMDSHDKAEFCRLMREWALCTSKAIVVVKQAILKAMDGNGNDCLAVVELLDYAVRLEELKSSDVLRAMTELDSAAATDLKLDIPDIEEMLNTFGGLMRTRGLLPAPSPRASMMISSPRYS